MLILAKKCSFSYLLYPKKLTENKLRLHGVLGCVFSECRIFLLILSKTVLHSFLEGNLSEHLKNVLLGRGTWRGIFAGFSKSISVTNLRIFDIGENCPNFVEIEENAHRKVAITSAN